MFGLIPLSAIVWLVAPVRLPIDVLFWPVWIVLLAGLWTMAKFYKKYT
jgi:hypothetical protein